MRIVVLCGSYPPAHRDHRSGGTLQAMTALVARLGGQHDFRVLTRHPGEAGPGDDPSPEPGRWHPRGEALVYYATDRDLVPDRLTRVLRSIDPDGYYVNSCLSPTLGISPVMLRWAGAIPCHPMIVAPRGELHPAALGTKRLKKRAFLEVARRLPAYRDLTWQAGSEDEAVHIRSAFGEDARIAIARDLTTLRASPTLPRPPKRRGELSLAYLGRITPMKNLLFAIRTLRHVRGSVTYDVYGPVVEAGYRDACAAEAARLPANVSVRFAGELPHERVTEALARHHGLFFPTLGESFGHAILEAMLAGCVPILSDQTPWRGLRAAGAGWDLPVGDERTFIEALGACADMGEDELARASCSARQLAEAAIGSSAALEENRAMLEGLRIPRG